MTERFTLLEKIGRGGMGVVWRARDEESGSIVALKLLHAAHADDPDYVTRFERELERVHASSNDDVFDDKWAGVSSSGMCLIGRDETIDIFQSAEDRMNRCAAR